MSKNLTGMRFGRLTALEPIRTEEKRGVIWKCRCECGGEKEVPARYLIRGQTSSCGCIQQEHRQRKDIAGERFGRLTAVRPTDQRDPGGSVIWECECDCGNLIYYSVSRLGSGCVQSCGCLYDDSRSRCSSYRQDLVEETSLSSLVGAKQCHSNNRSGYTGVCWNAQTGMWMAYINFRKKRYYLGFYHNLEDAGRERKKAEQRLHDPIIEEKFDCITRETQEKFREYLLENSTEVD